jgi:hypothetical protein
MSQLFSALDSIKADVATADATTIQQESKKLIKSHSKIIDTIVRSTKSQLRRYIGPMISSEEVESFLGGPYGKFMSLLHARREAVCERLVETATRGIGCDQNALIAGICLLPGRAMKDVSAALEKMCGNSLAGDSFDTH